MGQFYQGADIKFLDDAMYQAPYELMGNLLAKKDKEVGDTISANTELNGLIEKIASLQPDDIRAKEIREKYATQIENVADSIYADPMNAVAYMPKISGLKKEINTDWTSGEVSKIEANKSKYDLWEKELKEKIKAKPDQYPPDVVATMTAAKLAEFSKLGGTKYAGVDKYNQVGTEDVLALEDSADILKGVMEGAIPGVDKSVSWSNDRGGWTVKSDSSEKFFTPDQLQKMWINHLSTNPNIVSAVAQRKELKYSPYQKSFNEEGAVSFEDGSWFKTAMDQMQEKYGGKKTTDGGGSTMNALGTAVAKDEHDTVNLTTEVGGALTSMAGTDNTQFNTAYLSTKNNQNQAVNKALQAYADLYYKSNKKDPTEAANDRLEQFRTSQNNWKTYEKIRKGDFAPIINTPAGRASATQYKRALVDRAVLQSQITQFEKETGLSYAKLTTDPRRDYNYVTVDANGKSVNKKGGITDVWNNYLTHNSTKSVNRQMTWENSGYTAVQQKNIADQFFKSGKYMDTKVYYAPGTKIGGVDVGGNNYSLNDLVAKGIIIPEKKEIADKYTSGVATSFKSVNGKDYINLDMSERNFTPVWGYNDSDNIEFGFGVSVGGKTHFGRVDGVSTEVTRKLNSGDNALRFKTSAYLDKNAANVENFSIPGSDIIYHGREVKSGNKIIYPANSITRTVNGKKVTQSANTPEAQIVLGNAIFH